MPLKGKTLIIIFWMWIKHDLRTVGATHFESESINLNFDPMYFQFISTQFPSEKAHPVYIIYSIIYINIFLINVNINGWKNGPPLSLETLFNYWNCLWYIFLYWRLTFTHSFSVVEMLFRVGGQLGKPLLYNSSLGFPLRRSNSSGQCTCDHLIIGGWLTLVKLLFRSRM